MILIAAFDGVQYVSGTIWRRRGQLLWRGCLYRIELNLFQVCKNILQLNIVFVYLQTGLHWAAKHGNDGLVKMLAGTYKSDVNARTVIVIYLFFDKKKEPF